MTQFDSSQDHNISGADTVSAATSSPVTTAPVVSKPAVSAQATNVPPTINSVATVISSSTPGSTDPIEPKLNGTPKMALTPWKKKKEMTMLLIGETGVGKTAFMSLLANVCAGRQLHEFKMEVNQGNENGGSTSGSQTNEPMLYTFQLANGHILRVLDTPGLADTRGEEYDKQHKRNIATAIEKKISVIDGVLVMANGTLPRLGVATEYTLTTIAGMFPRSIADNIGCMFTMVTNPLAFNFSRDALPEELQKARIWTVDNPLAQWLKYQEKTHPDAPTLDDEILEEMLLQVKSSYRKTLKTLDDFFLWLDARSLQPVSAIHELYEMSTSIEAAISNVIAQLDQGEKERSELVRLQNQLSKQSEIKDLNKKYEEIIAKTTYEHDNTNDHNTLCVFGGCYKNCHLSCGVGFTMDRKQLGRDCSAFGATGQDGHPCLGCGHSAMDHQHYRSQWKEVIRSETITDLAAKARFEAATTEADKLKIMEEEVAKRVAVLETVMQENEDKLSDLCSKFNDLALSGSFAGYITSTIRLLSLRLDTMKKESPDVDAQNRMEERINSLKLKEKTVKEAEEKKKKQKGFMLTIKDMVFRTT